MPKGVLSQHKACTGYIQSVAAYYQLDPTFDVMSAASSQAWDTSVHEMYLTLTLTLTLTQAWDTSVHEMYIALASGVTSLMLDHDEVRSGNKLLDLFKEEKVSCAFLVPSLLRTLNTDQMAKLPWPVLRIIQCGGEALPQDLGDVWSEGRVLLNIYGTTEGTMYQTIKDVRPGEVINIGQPFQGWSTTIVNPDTLEELPVGETGEMLFGSDYLAAEYVNLPQLTNEKFIDYKGQRTYRTGDMGKRNEDGDFFFLGRIDTQVKIHGHRVELESIESQIMELPNVKLTAVVVDKKSKITAFVVSDGPQDHKLWIKKLEVALPHYAVPHNFIQVEELPRLQSGKIDRKGLVNTLAQLESCRIASPPPEDTPPPAPDDPHTKVQPPPPPPPPAPLDAETALALKMCQEVLENPDLTITDDLHANGLDSISGAKLANKFAQIGVAVNLTDIYTVSTVQELRPFVKEGLDNPIQLPVLDILKDHEEVQNESSMGYFCFTLCCLLWNILLFSQLVTMASG